MSLRSQKSGELLAIANASRRVKSALARGGVWNDPALVSSIARESGVDSNVVRRMLASQSGGGA